MPTKKENSTMVVFDPNHPEGMVYQGYKIACTEVAERLESIAKLAEADIADEPNLMTKLQLITLAKAMKQAAALALELGENVEERSRIAKSQSISISSEEYKSVN